MNYNSLPGHNELNRIGKTKINFKKHKYELKILDTTSENEYNNIDKWIYLGDGFLLVFAIDDEESFEILKKKRDRILEGKYGHYTPTPMILVGNKSDLKNERKVSFDVAKKLAESWGIEYIETSAITIFNCREPFDKLTKRIHEYKNPKSYDGPSFMCNVM